MWMDACSEGSGEGVMDLNGIRHGYWKAVSWPAIECFTGGCLSCEKWLQKGMIGEGDMIFEGDGMLAGLKNGWEILKIKHIKLDF